MTRLGQSIRVALAPCLFLVGAVWCGDAPRRAGKIYGTVVDATPDCSPEKCAMLAGCKSDKDARRVLEAILGRRPASGVIVTATNGRVTREVISDSQGDFTFTDLPMGTYGVSAMTPARPVGHDGKRKVSVTKSVECNRTIRLALHEALITVSGRITDPHGQPIAGARVIGTAVPVPEVGIIERKSTVSNANGVYELKGFEPLNLYRVAGYLNGGSLDAPGALYTQVEIQVEANGFRQDKASIPRVPLLAEAQIVPARRLWKALSELAVTLGNGEDWREMKKRPLPASRGNTIIDVDIVLEEEKGQTASRAVIRDTGGDAHNHPL